MRCFRVFLFLVMKSNLLGAVFRFAAAVMLFVWTPVLLAQPSGIDKLRGITAGDIDAKSDQVIVATEATLHGFALQGSVHSEDRKNSGLKRSKELESSGLETSKGWSIAIGFSQINALVLSPDQKTLLIAGGEPGQRGCVQCLAWPELTKGDVIETQVGSIPMRDVVTDVHWFPDGNWWIESHWNAMALVRRRNGTVVGAFSGHTGPVTCAIPWTQELAISCGIDQTIKVWEIESGKLVRSLDNHTGPVIALARWISPEGKSFLVSLGKDRTLRLWDPAIGRLVRFVKLPQVPLRMKISTSGSVRVLLENSSVAKVSLPMLGIEQAEVLDPTGLGNWFCK